MGSSPFVHLFDTNDVPTNEETSQILAVIQNMKARVEILTSQMSLLGATSDEPLQDKRDELQQSVDRHYSLVSCVRRVPADIWREIFIRSFCPHDPPTPSTGLPPLLFTRICRLWRDIAISTPRLWNRLFIEWGIDDAALTFDTRVTNEGIRTWLSRSGCLPLTIALHLEEAVLTPDLQAHGEMGLNRILSLLVQHSRRWKELWISGDADSACFLSPLLQLTASQVPTLHAYREIGTTILTPVIARNSPALRTLQLCGRSCDILNLPFSWSRLTDLSLWFSSEMAKSQRAGPRSVIRTLAHQCTSLVHCTLVFESRSFRLHPVSTPLCPIEWATLEDFYLSLAVAVNPDTRTYLHHTFDSIRAPRLTRFVLRVATVALSSHDHDFMRWSEIEPRTESPLHKFIAESGCRLISLGLYMPFGGPVFRTLDIMATTLRSLEVADFTPSEEYGTDYPGGDAFSPESSTVDMVLRYLMDAKTRNLPYLEEVEFTYCRPVQAALLKEFALSRPWKRMEVSFENVSTEECGMLSAMIGSGLGEGIRWHYIAS